MKRSPVALALFLLITVSFLSYMNISCSNEIVMRKVLFDSQGGSLVAAVEVVEGHKMKEPDPPARSGFSFDGWYEEIEYVNRWDFGMDVVNSDITLYAKWTADEYTITYHANGASSGSVPVESLKVHDVAQSISANLGNLERIGYAFAGWTDGSGTDYPEESSYVANVSITLYAKWTAIESTVTFEAYGGAPAPVDMSVTYDQVYGTLPSVSRTGYVFDGWYTGSNGTGSKVEDSTIVSSSENHTLYAKWTADTYRVVYDANGATGGYPPEEQTKTHDIGLVVHGNTGELVRLGYTFSGWNTLANGNGIDYSEGTTFAVDATTTLYAKWTAISSTVTFEAYGGTPVPGDKSVTYDHVYYTLPTVSRTGYAFDGWYTGSNGTGSKVEDSTIVSSSENHTLYAKWIVNTYSVVLDMQDGTGGSGSVTVCYDSPMPSATAPMRDYYNFKGYYDDADGTGTQYYTSTMESAHNWNIARDTRLYAKWEAMYRIGDIGPGGGYIFYDDAKGYDADGNGTLDSDEWDFLDDDHDYVLSGDRFLEAAPWGWYDGSHDPEFVFGYHRPDGSNSMIGTGTGVSLGSYNTLMLAYTMKDKAYTNSSGDSTTSDYAAKVCQDHVGGGYEDWFLPSKKELNLIYLNLHTKNLGGFHKTNYYWSSSECSGSSTEAWSHNFGNGGQFEYLRNHPFYVRPVHSF